MLVERGGEHENDTDRPGDVLEVELARHQHDERTNHHTDGERQEALLLIGPVPRLQERDQRWGTEAEC
jgi:hypothetical protein